VARGKLTEEQAESHPQRSVITRALGAYSEVEVDTEVFPARGGDVFLLCSDGLTGMVHEPQLKSLLEDRERSLEQTGRMLIAAANEAGGRDNITVILFRLEDVDDRRGGDTAVTTDSEAASTAEYETFSGEAVEPRQGVSRPTGLHASASLRSSPASPREVTAAVRAAEEAEAEYRRHGTTALQAIRPETQEGGTAAPAREPPPRTAPLPAQPRKTKRRRRRSGGTLLLMVAVIIPLLVGAWLATRAVYFVGTDAGAGRSVTIYRGLPYELPFGIDLYETYYESGVPLADVPAARRERFTDHQLRSRDDAEDLVIRLEKGQVE
jgi:protein phosphatase